MASTAGVDARDNTNTTGTGVPIYWLGGDKVADDNADFYDETWDDENGVTDESATAYTDLGYPEKVWTGSNHNGTVFDSDGLGTSDPMTGYIHFPANSVPGPIQADDTDTNTLTRPLYALSEVFTVGPNLAQFRASRCCDAGTSTMRSSARPISGWISLTRSPPPTSRGRCRCSSTPTTGSKRSAAPSRRTSRKVRRA